MLAGLQLTSLGALRLAQWPRLLVAVVGLGAALTGVGYVVHRASRILTDDWITLAQLSLAEFRGKLEQSDRLEGLFDDVETYREELYGQVATDLPGLYMKLKEVNDQDRAEPGVTPILEYDAMAVRDAARAVVQFANYYSTRAKFDVFIRQLARASVVVTIGVVVFAYAANPPDDSTAGSVSQTAR